PGGRLPRPRSARAGEVLHRPPGRRAAARAPPGGEGAAALRCGRVVDAAAGSERVPDGAVLMRELSVGTMTQRRFPPAATTKVAPVPMSTMLEFGNRDNPTTPTTRASHPVMRNIMAAPPQAKERPARRGGEDCSGGPAAGNPCSTGSCSLTTRIVG